MIIFAGMKIKISLTAKEDISRYSAIPPQTPDIDLSIADFRNLLYITYPPLQHFIIRSETKQFIFLRSFN